MSNPMTAAEALGRSVDALIAERDALAAEVAALRADAERLAFMLEKQVCVYRMKDTGLYAVLTDRGDLYDGSEHVTTRAAIDAARAEAGSHD